MEKLPLHPEYAKAPPIDKANNKKVSYFSRVNGTCVVILVVLKKIQLGLKGQGQIFF